jgi:branched-chain amino acid transport system substrate-binding protein
VIDPFSGPFALQGEMLFRHIQAAAEEINSGGVLEGRRIQLEPLDSKGSPQEALIALKQAIDEDIQFVMQGVGAHIAHALTEAIAKHNQRNPSNAILYLNYSAPDPALTNEKCNFWHFRFDSHSDMKLEVLTTALARDMSIKRVYLINQDYSYGQRVARMSREMLSRKRPDIRIVGEELHPLGRIKDFTPYVAKIKTSGADTILTGNWGNDLSLLIRSGAEAGLQTTYFTMWANAPGNGQSIGPTGTGRVRNVANWYVNVPNNPLLNVYLAYKKKHGGDWLFPPTRTALQMLAESIRIGGSARPATVARFLEGMRFDAGWGEMWMRPEDHQLIQPLYIATLDRVGAPGVGCDFENSGYGWRIDMRFEPAETALPTTCKMQKPADHVARPH